MFSIQVHILLKNTAEIVKRQNLRAMRSGVRVRIIVLRCPENAVVVISSYLFQVVEESSVGDLCSRDLGMPVSMSLT